MSFSVSYFKMSWVKAAKMKRKYTWFNYDSTAMWEALESMDEQVSALTRVVRALPEQWKKSFE